METLMVVGCDPLPGREDELNRWYSWVHIRDVMRLPGSLSAQRYALSPVQPATHPPDPAFAYLTLYEVGDKAACNRGHVDLVFTDRMPVSTAFDFDSFHECYFDPLAGAGARLPENTAEQAVMLVAADAGTDDVARFEGEVLHDALAELAALPGIAAASAYRFGSDQMMDLPARQSHLILCHLSDLSMAVAGWDSQLAGPSPFCEAARWRADVYLPLMRRLLARDVIGESDHARAIAAAARAALGNALHRPGANTHI